MNEKWIPPLQKGANVARGQTPLAKEEYAHAEYNVEAYLKYGIFLGGLAYCRIYPIS